MNLETFFEKFDLFADAPNAVAKMRELVLQLAVRGKLVDQIFDDESAEVLLKRIYRFKDRLIKERIIRRQETDPIDADSAPFVIPQSWAWTRLGEIGDWGSGSTPVRGSHELYGGGITWLKSGELNDNPALAGSSETVTELALETGSFRRNQPGDVLFAMYGATIGKVAILAEPAVTNQAVCGCTPFEGVSNRFLFAYLISQRASFHEASEGGAQPNLSKVKIVASPFPLPPLAEQKRIVAKVDELMALCDRLEEQQKERETRHAALARASLARFAEAPTPANLEFLFHQSYAIAPADLRKSILTLAVQGKLVPQDPNDESTQESLARCDELRGETARKDHRADEENQPLLSADDRWEIADAWVWRGLADLVLFVDYRGKTPAKLSSGVRLLTAKNVRKGQVNLSPEEFLSESEYIAWMTRGFPKAGDVLFTTEAPMGNAAVVELTERFALAQRVICFQSYGAIDPAFLVLQILSEQFQFILDKNGTGVTAKGIKASKLKQLPIAVPPLAEQRRIVAKVDELMALVDTLETQLATARTTATNLLAAAIAELTNPKELHVAGV
jgi:type I restriction enzyme S subunit